MCHYSLICNGSVDTCASMRTFIRHKIHSTFQLTITSAINFISIVPIFLTLDILHSKNVLRCTHSTFRSLYLKLKMIYRHEMRKTTLLTPIVNVVIKYNAQKRIARFTLFVDIIWLEICFPVQVESNSHQPLAHLQ